MPQASVRAGRAPRPPARTARGIWAPADRSPPPAGEPGAGAASRRAGAGQMMMDVSFPLDRDRLVPRLQCPDSPPRTDPTRGGASAAQTRFLYANQAPRSAPSLAPQADPKVERTAFAPNSCGAQPAQHSDGREKIVSGGAQFRGESLSFLHALSRVSRPKSAHGVHAARSGGRDSMPVTAVDFGAGHAGGGDSKRPRQRPASASAAATSSSSGNLALSSSRRPASATVRGQDREAVGTWSAGTVQLATKARPASARPASALSSTRSARSSRLPPRPASALGLGTQKSAGSGDSCEDRPPMTAPEVRADADHTALEALNEEEALRVAMARCMFGRQNSSIWQTHESERQVPRAQSAGPERPVKSEVGEELCDIDPAFFTLLVPGESKKEYSDKLEGVRRKLHGVFKSSPPNTKPLASRKPQTAPRPVSACRLDLIKDQLFEKARAGGSQLLSGTRIEGSRMMKMQWSKARVEERLARHRNEHQRLQLKQKIAEYRYEDLLPQRAAAWSSSSSSLLSSSLLSSSPTSSLPLSSSPSASSSEVADGLSVDEYKSNAEEQADGNGKKQEDAPKKETLMRRNAWPGGREGSVSQKSLLSQHRIPWAGQGVIRERKFPWEVAQAKHKEMMELREQRQRENERATLLDRVAMLAKYKWAREEDPKQNSTIANPKRNTRATCTAISGTLSTTKASPLRP